LQAHNLVGMKPTCIYMIQLSYSPEIGWLHPTCPVEMVITNPLSVPGICFGWPTLNHASDWTN